MKFLENIWNDLISSPTLMVLLGIVYVCSTIGQLITEQEIARREGALPTQKKTLPEGLAIFVIAGWILFIVALFLDWKVALSVRILIFLIESVPIIGLVGIIPRFIIMLVVEIFFGHRQIKVFEDASRSSKKNEKARRQLENYLRLKGFKCQKINDKDVEKRCHFHNKDDYLVFIRYAVENEAVQIMKSEQELAFFRFPDAEDYEEAIAILNEYLN